MHTHTVSTGLINNAIIIHQFKAARHYKLHYYCTGAYAAKLVLQFLIKKKKGIYILHLTIL